MLLFIIHILFSSLHVFYVSQCEIRYLPDDAVFQVSWKLFADDVEETIQVHRDPLFTLFEDTLETESRLDEYFGDHFKLYRDETPIPISLLGAELEGEDLWCFWEIPIDNAGGLIDIRLTALLDLYDEQQNYVTVLHNDSVVLSDILTKHKLSSSFELE